MPSLKMKILPKTLKILGQEVSVVQDSSLDKNDCGVADVEELQIRLNPRHSATVRITLIHELIHMAIGIAGVTQFLDEKQEEAICRCLEHALIDYIKFPGES